MSVAVGGLERGYGVSCGHGCRCGDGGGYGCGDGNGDGDDSDGSTCPVPLSEGGVVGSGGLAEGTAGGIFQMEGGGSGPQLVMEIPSYWDSGGGVEVGDGDPQSPPQKLHCLPQSPP